MAQYLTFDSLSKHTLFCGRELPASCSEGVGRGVVHRLFNPSISRTSQESWTVPELRPRPSLPAANVWG